MERKTKPIKKISVEESAKYLLAKNDFYSQNIHFYTVTPSKDSNFPSDDGWEDITYFTKKKISNLEK